VNGTATLAGFITFVTNVLRPPAPFDPTTDPAMEFAFNFAVQWVLTDLVNVPGVVGAPLTMYQIAVNNLAADTLINIAIDPNGAPIVQNSEPPLPFWAFLRQKYNILSFIPGIVQSSGDVSTNVGYMVPKSFENYSVMDLQNLKTPFGRVYLSIAGAWGPVWGLS
jgi:hypothetical protein